VQRVWGRLIEAVLWGLSLGLLDTGVGVRVVAVAVAAVVVAVAVVTAVAVVVVVAVCVRFLLISSRSLEQEAVRMV
jgi:hypothetical protein